MKIGVISDTHGLVPAWEKAMELFSGAEIILHAGDVLYHPPRMGFTPGYDIPGLAQLLNSSPIPVLIARGNCDSEVYEELLDIPVQSPYAVAHIGAMRIVVQHGHTLTSDDIAQAGHRYGADVFITGHTHVPVIQRLGGVIHLNPGSPAHPKFQRDGEFVPTVGVIEDGVVRVIELQSGNELISERLR